MRSSRRRIIQLDEVDSTNAYAERLIASGRFPEGTVVSARYQSAGKGQGAHRWESERGKNILMTILLKPSFLPAGSQFLLNKAVTLGVCDCLTALGLTPAIKWPNDLYAGQGKIGGILITHRVSGEVITATIAGIGININQSEFPGSLSNPVSVKTLTGRETDPGEALIQLIGALDRRYAMLKKGDPGTVEEEYLKKLAGLGQFKTYRSAAGEFEGKICGVDAFGRLLVETRDRKVTAYMHGEIIL